MKVLKVFKKALFSTFLFLKPKLNYFALGDSTVASIGATSAKFTYPAQLAKLLRADFRVKLTNLGKSGATSYDVIETQISAVLKHSPNLITISVRPNDIKKLKRVGEFKRNLELILTLLIHTRAKIVMTTIADMSKLPLIPKLTRFALKLRVEQFNKVICDLGKKYDIFVCDLFEKSQNFSQVGKYLAEDKFHPSNLDYKIWADNLYSDIKFLLVK